MSNLIRSVEIAESAHEGVIDKCGEPYINHPKRIMNNAKSIKAKIVAVLHDVVEDTSWTLDDLRHEGFDEEIIEGVDGMTRRNDESYMEFIRRASKNELSLEVKILDLKDNTDLNRIPPGSEDWFYKNRNGKYKKALNFLLPMFFEAKDKKLSDVSNRSVKTGL